MQSHNFRVGTWRKKNQTVNDHYHFLMNSTNAQRSFIHELMHQQLTGSATNLWGAMIPKNFHAQASRQTLNYIKYAAKKPAHEFGRLISAHKEGSGIISTIGELIGNGAKTVGSYMNSVGGWVAANGNNIRHGVQMANELIRAGTTVGNLTGMVSDETANKIDSISSYVNKRLNPGNVVSGLRQPRGGQILI